MTGPLNEEQFHALETAARACLERDCSCHDWDHTRRVLSTALQLAQTEGGDPGVITAAALLHDIARPEEMADQGKTDHALLGSQKAAEILQKLQIGDTPWQEHVCQCIRSHRYRSRNGEPPASIEARVLYDADKLDSLGAIGLARAFHFAGKTGARVHNTKEEALSGASYGREDSAYREYLVKLQHLPEAMLTSTGHALALQRAAFMQAFFQELDQECAAEAAHS